jgi:hypothetical protein
MLAEYRGFLPVHERFKGMSVCQQWRDILSDQQFWTNIGTPLLIFSPTFSAPLHFDEMVTIKFCFNNFRRSNFITGTIALWNQICSSIFKFVGVATKKLICEFATSSRELFISERSRNMRFLKVL